MSKKQAPGSALREEVSKRFAQAIKAKGLSKAEAARLLGVKRQTLYLYLDQKATPGGEVLKRACELWNITLTVNGFSFSSEAFPASKREPQPVGQQMTIWDVLKGVKSDHLQAKVLGPSGDHFDIQLRIKVRR